jgi:hypothetical protein
MIGLLVIIQPRGILEECIAPGSGYARGRQKFQEVAAAQDWA